MFVGTVRLAFSLKKKHKGTGACMTFNNLPVLAVLAEKIITA
jgi:hypothetical protein